MLLYERQPLLLTSNRCCSVPTAWFQNQLKEEQDIKKEMWT